MDIRYIKEAANLLQTFLVNPQVLLESLSTISSMAKSNRTELQLLRIELLKAKQQFDHLLETSNLSQQGRNVLLFLEHGQDFLAISANIERILSKLGHESQYGEVSNYMDTLIQRLNWLQSWSQRMVNSLNHLKPPDYTVESDQAAVRLIFQKNVSINTLEDLQEKSGDWSRTLSLLHQVNGLDYTDTPLLAVYNGSLLEDILTNLPVVQSIFTIISNLTSTASSMMAVRKLIKEAEVNKKSTGMEDYFDKHIQELEERLKAQQQEAIEEATKKVLEQAGFNPQKPEDNELPMKAKTAVGNINTFINNGGDVILINAPTDNKEEHLELMRLVERAQNQLKTLREAKSQKYLNASQDDAPKQLGDGKPEDA